eukprot:6192242-Pleurochrysis_carterae.AAC.2
MGKMSQCLKVEAMTTLNLGVAFQITTAQRRHASNESSCLPLPRPLFPLLVVLLFSFLFLRVVEAAVGGVADGEHRLVALEHRQLRTRRAGERLGAAVAESTGEGPKKDSKRFKWSLPLARSRERSSSAERFR